ncbi:MAG: GTP-binding protein [Planctomycetota bacterium]|nr:GTP-binding protein [Planctomycetota bacterium]
MQATSHPQKIQTPVTLITGWLGAGKTTLLNRILSENHGQKFAVLVNEFGDLGIDDKLIVRQDSNLVELSNGCICCTVRGDMISALLNLRKRRLPFLKRRQFDRVLIETTGIAEPAPLLRSFLVEESVATYFAVDKIISLADARHLKLATEHKSAIEQLALADTIFLNHSSALNQEQIDDSLNTISDINADAKIIIDEITTASIDDILQPSEARVTAPAPVASSHQHSITTVSISSPDALDELKLRLWLDTCVQQLGEELIRYKGFLHIEGINYRCLLQGVYDLYQVSADDSWADQPYNEIVFIGHNLDRNFFERGFNAARAT